MRFSRFFMVLSAVLMLSACGTVHDDPAKHNDLSNWLNSRPSKIEEHTWKMPTGYAGQNNRLREVKSAGGSVSTFPLEDDMPAPIGSEQQQVVQLSPPSAGEYGQMAGQIFFLHGSSRLTGPEKRDIASVASSVGSGAPVGITVVGHASQRVDGVTDPIRRKEINYEMAQKRAVAVTRELSKAGVNPAWIQSVSKGDDEPNASPGGRSQEAADRRVEIYTK